MIASETYSYDALILHLYTISDPVANLKSSLKIQSWGLIKCAIFVPTFVLLALSST